MESQDSEELVGEKFSSRVEGVVSILLSLYSFGFTSMYVASFY